MTKIIIPLLISLSSISLAMTAAKPKSLPDRLDAVLTEALSEKRIVGSVVIVMKDGEILYHKAHGLADRESERKMKEGDLFRLASLTKTITATAVLRLVDQGKMKLEDPVTRWIPEFKPKTPDGKAPVITIQNLLNHTSGVSYALLADPQGPYSKLKISDGLQDDDWTLEENTRRMGKGPLRFKPGTQWEYSLGLDVLGRVIEKVTGKKLDQAIKELVTEPLNMKQTVFVADKAALATPYANSVPAPVRMSPRFVNKMGPLEVVFAPERASNPKAFFSGGAGMSGTAMDYVLLLEALRKGSFLKSETAKTLAENSTGSLGISLAGPGWGWGQVGALLMDPEAAKMPMKAGTLGWSGVYGNSWWMDPKSGLSVVILTNTSFEGMIGKLPNDIRAEVYR